jgi:hypothetical protein
MLMATLSFAHDIRAMFRDKDVQEMMDIANFDLSNYADVRAHAADIYERVADGSMPCDGAWSAEQIAKFKQWLVLRQSGFEDELFERYSLVPTKGWRPTNYAQEKVPC